MGLSHIKSSHPFPFLCFEPDVTDSAVLPCLSITEIHTVESAESQHSCCFALPGQQVQQNHEQIVRNCNK